MSQRLNVALVILLMGGAPALAAIRIEVHYVIVETEVSPRQETRRSDHSWGTTFILDHNRVTRMSGSNQFSGRLNETIFGENQFHHQYSTHYTLHKNNITEIDHSPGQIESIKIENNGGGGCNAIVSFRPIRGQKYIIGNRISNNETLYISEMHAEDITCSMTKVEPPQ